jgi:UDP-N-acetylmuramyl tripeptide synthase
MKIIAITGTKGKTSVARLIDFTLLKMNFKTLRVDSDGSFINGRQESNRKYSQEVFKNPPTVQAGKYLNLYKDKSLDYAVLEQSLSSGKEDIGLGYLQQDTSVFTNIFSDHIDYKKIKSKQDLFDIKLKILSKTKGWIVSNWDDDFGRKVAEKVKNAVLFYGTSEDILQNENYIYYKNKTIKLRFRKNKLSFSLEKYNFPVNEGFLPSIYNLMASLGALTCLDFNPEEIKRILETYEIDKSQGRLVLKTYKGKRVLLDNAHETNSIIEVGKLCSKLGRKVIGVLRLSPERVNQVIQETGKAIAKSGVFDHIIVYDFIDGVYSSESLSKPNGKSRKVGEVVNILAMSLKEGNKSLEVDTILNEQDALKKALKIASKDDIVLMIHHRYKKSLGVLKK